MQTDELLIRLTFTAGAAIISGCAKRCQFYGLTNIGAARSIERCQCKNAGGKRRYSLVM